MAIAVKGHQRGSYLPAVRRPGMMAGVDLGGHGDYSSPEQRSTDLLTWALRPWLYRIARAVSTLLPSTRGPSSTRAPWSGRPCSTATPRTRWDRGRLAAALRGSQAGGPPAHPGHRRPATARSRCRLTVHTREFALELEVRAEGRMLEAPSCLRRGGPYPAQVVEAAGRARSPAPHPGDLPLLALPLVAVSPARWATPPGRTCATVSRASTSERATTPGLPFPRVVARTGPGALVQPGLRADGVPPRCSGDHTPIHRHTKERQRRHRRYGPAMALRSQGGAVEGRLKGGGPQTVRLRLRGVAQPYGPPGRRSCGLPVRLPHDSANTVELGRFGKFPSTVHAYQSPITRLANLH
jgi:hypothetical protein